LDFASGANAPLSRKTISGRKTPSAVTRRPRQRARQERRRQAGTTASATIRRTIAILSSRVPSCAWNGPCSQSDIGGLLGRAGRRLSQLRRPAPTAVVSTHRSRSSAPGALDRPAALGELLDQAVAVVALDLDHAVAHRAAGAALTLERARQPGERP